jgi:hypothetical protein
MEREPSRLDTIPSSPSWQAGAAETRLRGCPSWIRIEPCAAPQSQPLGGFWKISERMPELGPYGSVRGALSNERPYRDLRNVAANYPFERSHRFPGSSRIPATETVRV